MVADRNGDHSSDHNRDRCRDRKKDRSIGEEPMLMARHGSRRFPASGGTHAGMLAILSSPGKAVEEMNPTLPLIRPLIRPSDAAGAV